ncbi:MAG: DUF3471 domain-containing protein [Gemmatimonadaceae bacterium]
MAYPLSIAAGQTTTPPQHRPPTTITSSFTSITSYFAGRLLQAFDSIPASRFAYAPTPVQQTVGYVAQHLVGANYSLCERIGELARPPLSITSLSDSAQAKLPKDTLIAWLRDSFRFCTAAMSKVNDVNLGQSVPIGPPGTGRTQLRSTAFVLFVTDLAEHYSQIASYMRLIGLVPPSGLAPGKYTAISLSPAALSRYVGTYGIAPSSLVGSPALQFEITLKGDTLTLKPVGQPAGRLWPASETEFFFKEIAATISFDVDGMGRVTGVVLHSDGEDRPGTKIK